MIKKLQAVEEKQATGANGPFTIYNLTFSDGEKSSSYKDEGWVAKIGTEVDVNISTKPGSQYTTCYMNKPKQGFGGGAPRNLKTDALSSAVAWCKGNTHPATKEPLTSKDVILCAELFHAWIKGS